MTHSSDHPEVIDGDEDDDGAPRSYGLEYLLLDQSDPDDPVWVLTTVVAATEAKVDGIGQPPAEEPVTALVWAGEHLDRATITSQPVPGSGHTYRLEDGEE